MELDINALSRPYDPSVDDEMPEMPVQSFVSGGDVGGIGYEKVDPPVKPSPFQFTYPSGGSSNLVGGSSVRIDSEKYFDPAEAVRRQEESDKYFQNSSNNRLSNSAYINNTQSSYNPYVATMPIDPATGLPKSPQSYTVYEAQDPKAEGPPVINQKATSEKMLADYTKAMNAVPVSFAFDPNAPRSYNAPQMPTTADFIARRDKAGAGVPIMGQYKDPNMYSREANPNYMQFKSNPYAPITTMPIENPNNGGGTVDIQVVVYGPDGKMYSSPAAARAAGVTNYTSIPPGSTVKGSGAGSKVGGYVNGGMVQHFAEGGSAWAVDSQGRLVSPDWQKYGDANLTYSFDPSLFKDRYGEVRSADDFAEQLREYGDLPPNQRLAAANTYMYHLTGNEGYLNKKNAGYEHGPTAFGTNPWTEATYNPGISTADISNPTTNPTPTGGAKGGGATGGGATGGGAAPIVGSKDIDDVIGNKPPGTTGKGVSVAPGTNIPFQPLPGSGQTTTAKADLTSFNPSYEINKNLNPSIGQLPPGFSFDPNKYFTPSQAQTKIAANPNLTPTAVGLYTQDTDRLGNVIAIPTIDPLKFQSFYTTPVTRAAGGLVEDDEDTEASGAKQMLKGYEQLTGPRETRVTKSPNAQSVRSRQVSQVVDKQGRPAGMGMTYESMTTAQGPSQASPEQLATAKAMLADLMRQNLTKRRFAEGGEASNFTSGASDKKGAPVHMQAGGFLSALAKEVLASKGRFGLKRLERAADEIPNLDKLYTEKALERAFLGDNAKALMTINPKDFEKYASPLWWLDKSPEELASYHLNKIGSKANIRDLQKIKTGFNDVPFLEIDKAVEGSTKVLPKIKGHEGRHRNRAMAANNEQSGLVILSPRSGLRESFPRKYPDEYLDALKKELGLTGNKVSPEGYYTGEGDYEMNFIKRPPVDLPDLYADGGYVEPTNPFGGKAATQAKRRAEAEERARIAAAREKVARAPVLDKVAAETTDEFIKRTSGIDSKYDEDRGTFLPRRVKKSAFDQPEWVAPSIVTGAMLPYNMVNRALTGELDEEKVPETALNMMGGNLLLGKTAKTSAAKALKTLEKDIDRDRTWIRAKKEHDEGAPPAGTTLSRQPGDRKITKRNTRGGVWLTESPEVADSYMGKTGYAIPVHSQKPDLVLDAKGMLWSDFFDDVGPKAKFSNAEWEAAKANPKIKAIEIRNVYDPGGKHGGFPADMSEEEMRKALTSNNLFLKKPFEGSVVGKYTDEPFEYKSGGAVKRADGSPKKGETAPAPRRTDLEKLTDEAKQYSQYNDLMDFLASRLAVPEISQKYLGPSTGGQFVTGWSEPKNGRIELNWESTPSTLVHELTHAADRQISHQVSDLEERHRKETPLLDYLRNKTVLSPDEVRLVLGHRKLGYGSGTDFKDPAKYPRRQLVDKLAPEWSKENSGYRSASNELAAYGMGSTVPRRNSRAPLHVDPTMATEFSILLDLAQRAQKAKPPTKE